MENSKNFQLRKIKNYKIEKFQTLENSFNIKLGIHGILIVFKITEFKKSTIFEIEQYQKFDDYRNCIIWKNFRIFRIGNFWNFTNWKFLKLNQKLEN